MLIYGKEVRDTIKKQVQEAVEKTPMSLSVIQVGEDPASASYVKGIEKFGIEVGIPVKLLKLDQETKEDQVISIIESLNQDPDVTGIMIQTPLPKQLNQDRITKAMNPKKDVEGIHNENLGMLVSRKEFVQPSTPKAVMSLLQANAIDLRGKRVTIIGRSTIVGTPLTLMLMDRDATVTLCHSRTKDLARETLRADIIVAAAGKMDLITEDMVGEHSIVIDVGTNFDKQGKMHGDVSEAAKNKAFLASAVPGGVGTITVAELFHNLTVLREGSC